MGYDLSWAIGQLEPRKGSVTAEEASYALRQSASVKDVWIAGPVLVTALMMATRVSPGDTEEFRSAIAAFAQSVGRRDKLAAVCRNRLKRGLAKLAQAEPDDGTLDLSVISSGDGWSAVVGSELSRWHQATAGVNALLRHLAAASGSKPSKKWLSQARQHLSDPDGVRVLRLLVETLATAPAGSRASRGSGQLVVSGHNADLVRAAAWAAALVPQPWVTPGLRAAADRAINGTWTQGYVESDKVPNACIYSLGMIATPESIAALQSLQRTTKNAAFRKLINGAITSAARDSGLTPGQLVERVVPEAGLDSDSERRIELTETSAARIRVTEQCRVVLEWRKGDEWVGKDPAGLGASKYPAIRAATKGVKEALAGERFRLESLFADDRQWPAGQWRDLYLSHPVTGQLSRRLLWTASGRVTGIPMNDGRLMTMDGPAEVPSDAVVRLWHPARAATAEVRRWRDRLVRDEFVQPFKQAYREVYLLTPAERETRLYSNRFASHILRYQQAFALMKQRNWTSNFLGPHDGGNKGQARHEFADAGLTAVFEHFAVDPGDRGGRVELCSTDRVWFYRTSDRGREPVPLDDIPDLVFSEAMRDVDLFVGVTSIALDPNWFDRGDDPHLGYWHEFSFGELTETAAIRHDVLARLIPRLTIADRLELTDRFLRVRGRKNTYRIHIGSANIQIEPDNRYLCIVPASSGRPKVMLPFDGDNVLSVILSKAILLAADNKITDQTILHQLRRR